MDEDLILLFILFSTVVVIGLIISKYRDSIWNLIEAVL